MAVLYLAILSQGALAQQAQWIIRDFTRCLPEGEKGQFWQQISTDSSQRGILLGIWNKTEQSYSSPQECLFLDYITGNWSAWPEFPTGNTNLWNVSVTLISPKSLKILLSNELRENDTLFHKAQAFKYAALGNDLPDLENNILRTQEHPSFFFFKLLPSNRGE